MASTLNNLAALYLQQQRSADAEPLLGRSLAIREAVLPASHPDISASLSSLAAFHYQNHDWVTAVSYARRATSIMIERARRATNSGVVGPADAARREVAYRPQGDPFAVLMLAVWPLAEQQPDRRALSEETFIAAQWMEQNVAGAALTQMANRFAKGEGDLSRLVREQQNLSMQWQQLDRQIVAARTLPLELRNAEAEAIFASRLADVDKRLVILNDRLAKDFPEHAALAAPSPLSFGATQGQLRPNEVLVQFTFALKESFAWVITSRGARWERLGDTPAEIRTKVQTLRCGLDREGEWEWSQSKGRWLARRHECAPLRPEGFSADELPPFDLAVAHELYRDLFGQIETDIKGKKLIIVPSGPLTSLPFHVLVTQDTNSAIPQDPAEYREVAWLVNSHAITVLPSVASLKALRALAKISSAPNGYIAFGNPLLEGKPDSSNDARRAREARQKQRCAEVEQVRAIGGVIAERGLRTSLGGLFRGDVADIEAIRQVSPLPETADEICAVARDLSVPSSEIYLGARATERQLKVLSAEGKLAKARIVHFATHGVLSSESEAILKAKAEPGLILTPPSSGTEGKDLEVDDGLLTASEIAQLELNADWLVLSACNTAAGEHQNTDALSGLVRAFLYAGTRAMLVSHWYVDSASAVRLTTRTFTELKATPEIGRAEALRRSMVALMTDQTENNSGHPAFWAPFVVVGDGETEHGVPSPLSQPVRVRDGIVRPRQ